MISHQHDRFFASLKGTQLQGVLSENPAQNAHRGYEAEEQDREKNFGHHGAEQMRKTQPDDRDGRIDPGRYHVHDIQGYRREQHPVSPGADIYEQKQEHHGHSGARALVFSDIFQTNNRRHCLFLPNLPSTKDGGLSLLPAKKVGKE